MRLSKKPTLKTNRSQRGAGSYRRGLRAEMAAVIWLIGKGYLPHAVRYRSRGGEIDIIAQKGRVFAAVEVKARPDFIRGHESMNDGDWQRRRAAMDYFMRRKTAGKYSIRFDLIVVAPYFRIQHLEAAWQERF